MTDGVFPDRLTQLRARWEADPSSRIFLQLAEEYRHLGRVQDALAVLDKGLREHPGYLSALVAKGRCHLELGEAEAARVVLERVVKQDATQMVANKLLVRAYLETGDPVKARERLDLYSLLNDGDPETEDLRRRIRQLEKPAQPEPESPPGPVFDAASPARDPSTPPPLPQWAQATPSAPAPAPAADVFDLDFPARPAPSSSSVPAASVTPRAGDDDIFSLPPTAAALAAAAPAPVAADPFSFDPQTPAPPPVPSMAAEAPLQARTSRSDDPFDLEPVAPRSQDDEDLLFPEVSVSDSRRRYLEALGSEGLFAVEPPPPAAPVSQSRPAPALEAADPFAHMPFPLEPFAAPPPVSLTSEPFAPAAPSMEEAAPVEEGAWLDDAASATAADAPVPVHEPLSPPIFAPEPPPSSARTAAEATTADELWAEEPVPAAWAEVPEPIEPPLEATVVPPTIDLEALPLPDLPDRDIEDEPHPIFVPEPSLGLQPPSLEPEPIVRVLPETLPEEQSEPVWEPEPLPEPEVAPEPAPAVAYTAGEATNGTVTLGDLYFRQGHYAEAERHFREVLERHPDNAAAREGLERIAALGPQPETPALDARRLLAGYRPNPVQPADAEARSRKVFLLNRYLDRLRQGSHHDVP